MEEREGRRRHRGIQNDRVPIWHCYLTQLRQFCPKAHCDHEQEYGAKIIATAYRGFYVNDCLTSIPGAETATNLVPELCSLLSKGGFCLTKWISNSREVINSISKLKWSKGALDLDLSSNDLPLERALDLHWNVKKNSLIFKVKSRGKPNTRPGILLVINFTYDPLVFGGVAVLPLYLSKF